MLPFLFGHGNNYIDAAIKLCADAEGGVDGGRRVHNAGLRQFVQTNPNIPILLYVSTSLAERMYPVLSLPTHRGLDGFRREDSAS